MFKTVLVLLLLAHVLGEFYAGTWAPFAQNPSNNCPAKRTALYSLSFIVVFLFGVTVPLIVLAGTSLLGHCVVCRVCSHLAQRPGSRPADTPGADLAAFVSYHGAHAVLFFALSYCFVSWDYALPSRDWATAFAAITNVSVSKSVSWITLLLMVCRPTNDFISKFLSCYKVENENPEDLAADNKAGRVIGILERILIVVFVSLNQYSAIGLVLAAKSIARYERIAKKPHFAEYYLLGTLLSIVAAMGASFIL